MAVLGFNSMAWVPDGVGLAAIRAAGFDFYQSSDGTPEIRTGLYFRELRVSGTVYRRTKFAAPLPEGATYLSFRVPGDYVTSLNSAIGLTTSRPPGTGQGHRSQGVGFQRNPNGQVRLCYAISTSVYHVTEWYALGAPEWSASEPNSVTIDFSGASYDLYVNGAGPLISVDKASVAPVLFDLYGFFAYQDDNLSGFNVCAGSFAFSTSFLGVYSIREFRPGADGPTDFTPDEGADGYSRINDALPDGDASYVEARENGSKAQYQYRDINGNPIEVQSQQTVRLVRCSLSSRVDGADTRYLRVLVSDGDAQAGVGAAQVRGVYSSQQIDIPNNPLTGLAWQPEDFDNLQLGFQIDDEAE